MYNFFKTYHRDSNKEVPFESFLKNILSYKESVEAQVQNERELSIQERWQLENFSKSKPTLPKGFSQEIYKEEMKKEYERAAEQEKLDQQRKFDEQQTSIDDGFNSSIYVFYHDKQDSYTRKLERVKKGKKARNFSLLKVKKHPVEITSNKIFLKIRIDDNKLKFAKLISGGNYDFWDHSPAGFALNVSIEQFDDDLLDTLARAIRSTRSFSILPSNISLSCFYTKEYPLNQRQEKLSRMLVIISVSGCLSWIMSKM